MSRSRAKVLLVPPLSAHGAVASMTLYWADLKQALTPWTQEGWELEDVTVPVRWRCSKLSRRVSQRILLPMAVRRLKEAARNEEGRLFVHVLDQHYANVLPTRGGTITCHDLDALVTPGKGLHKWEERQRIHALPKAASIHAISGSTARDVSRFFPEAASRVVVNYYGLDPRFQRRQPDIQAAHVSRLLQEQETSLVLHVGSNVERKNIPCLLSSFAALKRRAPDRRFRLVKVGDDLDKDGFGPQIDQLGLRQDLIYLGKLNIDQVVDVYNLCHVFAFPSLYEGFGRPLAEAQACGLPCVAARTSSLPEVGGDAAFYHDALDFEQAAELMATVVLNDEIRERSVAAGLTNATRFTWQSHARLLVESWQQHCRMLGD